MSSLSPRTIEILKIIIEEYMITGEVLGSKLLLKKYDLGVSSATVRSDMASLEKLELVYQPYNSAGRLPTTKGLRAFVNYLMQETPDYMLEAKNEEIHSNNIKEFSDLVYSLVFKLAKNTQEISFFLLPDKHIVEYSGVAEFLQKNHARNGDEIFQLLKMLEEKPQFSKFIQGFPLQAGVNIFIGEENMLPYLKDYTVILKPFEIEDSLAYIGIIGGLKMNYSFNISAVRGII